MARITLIGGHGKIALLATPLLVAAGHEVRSVIRNPDHAAEVAAAGGRPLHADIEQLDLLGSGHLVSDSDLVIWAAGAGGGDPRRTYAVDRDAAMRTVDAAQNAGVARWVMVSYFGAGPDHGVPQDHAFYAYAEAKAAADARLRGSELDWTILGPSGLTDDPGTGRIEVAGEGVEAGTVSRADVAEVIAQVVDRTDLGRTTIEFNNGPTPVAEALDTVATAARG
jgi:nucleoside-diphosphate-sugar epimerase